MTGNFFTLDWAHLPRRNHLKTFGTPTYQYHSQSRESTLHLLDKEYYDRQATINPILTGYMPNPAVYRKIYPRIVLRNVSHAQNVLDIQQEDDDKIDNPRLYHSDRKEFDLGMPRYTLSSMQEQQFNHQLHTQQQQQQFNFKLQELSTGQQPTKAPQQQQHQQQPPTSMFQDRPLDKMPSSPFYQPSKYQ